jgi:hypothetical protein
MWGYLFMTYGPTHRSKRPRKVVQIQLYSFFNLGPASEWVINATIWPFTTQYALYKSLSGRMRQISHPTGFDPRTVQQKASRYTDCAIPAQTHSIRLVY